LDAVEHGDGIVFLYSVKPGPANRSFGLQVARLAGVPEGVVGAARDKLYGLEEQYANVINGGGAGEGGARPVSQTSLFARNRSREQAVIDRLKSAAVDELSPRQALDLLYDLREGLG
ncbi:MAG: DNA mismatch repair protein MutS, partial [Gammaproteobacteria bacterium]|nr:DNA mismatch repair protein MutS [Gammaproteobacteria bacterium]